MNTYAFELVNSLDGRWEEVETLITQVRNETAESTFQKALRRSVSVFIVAHFEGFLKDLVRTISEDINRFIPFERLSNGIKRSICLQFTEDEKRIQRLQLLLSDANADVTPEAFLFERNRNPSPSVLHRICENLDMRNVFSILEVSDLRSVFLGSIEEAIKLRDAMRDHLILGSAEYPYTVDFEQFGLKEVQSKRRIAKTFWEEFLDQLLKYRNAIAHGSNSELGIPIQELELTQLKIQLLQEALILIFLNKLNQFTG